mgnify:CR=1 FL=1
MFRMNIKPIRAQMSQRGELLGDNTNMVEVVLIGLATLALLGIVFEEAIHLNKAKSTLFLGCLSWVVLFIFAPSSAQREAVHHKLDENLLEIATLWLFLTATMTFVAYLNAKGLIQTLVQRLFPQTLPKRHLLIVVALFALVLSAICDNVTATLVSLGILQAFNLDNRTRIKLATLVVFAVNSGGVALITGDVTTLMIFLAGHVSMLQLLSLLLPSVVSVLVLTAFFSLGMDGELSADKIVRKIQPLDVIIAVLFFSTIIATMAFNFFFAIPPVLTFLLGLSIMFLAGRSIRTDREEIRILEYIRQIEFDTLLFFLGILLLVGMLKEIGTLELIAGFYAKVNPELSNYIAGAASSLLDNVPLTAALLKASPSLNTAQWLGLTYAVGVGGSLLAIGSAAGIIAMSKVKGLTFIAYLRYLPALLLAYSVGYGCTLIIASTLFAG